MDNSPGKSCRLAEFLWVSVASGDNRPDAQSRSLNGRLCLPLGCRLCGEKSEKSVQRLNAYARAPRMLVLIQGLVSAAGNESYAPSYLQVSPHAMKEGLS